jgi:hypothetical protein
MSSGTFGWSIITGAYRDINISQWIMNHPNARPRWIIAAVFWRSVKGGAGYLTCPATIALIEIDFYDFYDFLFFLTHDG